MSSTARKESSVKSKFPLKGRAPSGKENAYPSASTRPKKLSYAGCEKQGEETISRRRFSLTVDEQKNESVGSNHATDAVGISNNFPVKKTPFRVHCDKNTSAIGKRKPLPRRGVSKPGTSCLEPTINTRNSRYDEQKPSHPRPARTTKSPTAKGLQPRSRIPLLVGAKESQKQTRLNLDIQKEASRLGSINASTQNARRSASVSRLPVRADHPIRRFASDDITRIQNSETFSAQRRVKKSSGSSAIKSAASLMKNSVTRSMSSLFNDRPSLQANPLQSSNNYCYERTSSSRKQWFVSRPSVSKVTKPKVSFQSTDLESHFSGSCSNISSIERPLRRGRTDTPGIIASNLQVNNDRQHSQIFGSQPPVVSQSVSTPVQAGVPIPTAAIRPITLAVENDVREIRMRKRTRSGECDEELFSSELIQHGEYHEDLPITEMEKEQLWPRLSDKFLLRDVNAEQRNLVVSFLVHSGVHCKYPSFIIYQSVKLFDVVIDRIPMETIHIQLTALAALWIVLKRHINVHKVPSATKLIALAKGLYEDQEDLLMRFERMILQTVNFNLSCADPFSLVAYHLINCSRHFDISDEQMTILYNSGSYLIDLSLLHEHFCSISTCLIAFSAAELVLSVTLDNINANIQPRTFWRVFLRGASSQSDRFQDEDLAALRVALIRRVLCSGVKQSLSNAVYKKYKRSKYGRISDSFFGRIRNMCVTELLDP